MARGRALRSKDHLPKVWSLSVSLSFETKDAESTGSWSDLSPVSIRSKPQSRDRSEPEENILHKIGGQRVESSWKRLLGRQGALNEQQLFDVKQSC